MSDPTHRNSVVRSEGNFSFVLKAERRTFYKIFLGGWSGENWEGTHPTFKSAPDDDNNRMSE
jgi:hypothetical protein